MDAHAGLCLCCSHVTKSGFFMSRTKYYVTHVPSGYGVRWMICPTVVTPSANIGRLSVVCVFVQLPGDMVAYT